MQIFSEDSDVSLLQIHIVVHVTHVPLGLVPPLSKLMDLVIQKCDPFFVVDDRLGLRIGRIKFFRLGQPNQKMLNRFYLQFTARLPDQSIQFFQ